MSPAAASAVAVAGLSAGRRALEEAERLGARVLIADDPEYPPLLSQIPDSPPVLFALGNLRLLQRPAVAIVGSRDHSPYGAEVARALSWGAASCGLAVVSGMARGLDAVAHVAALDAGGGTIGVLGNGVGVIYPTANRELYQRVAATGLLLTEFPPGERPSAGSFPRRNRLISGLARVTVVVEAAEGSGALITAGTALDQGREVMVVPGNITSPSSVGANRLIRDGAAPLLSSDDLLEHYPESVRPSEGFGGPPPATVPLPDALPAGHRAVAELLGTEPVLLEDLVGRSGRPPQDLLAALCALEIAGVVEQRPGRQFRRV
ncbi:MAG: DNA-protecting protein DprA [Gemmatimonadales bacterium]|nr:DNA-protecting protein DprA [Gemmatimonadales bacterium]